MPELDIVKNLQVAKSGKEHHILMIEEILSQAENQNAPWQRPWTVTEMGDFQPRNFKTGKPYNGSNLMYFATIQALMGTSDGRWLTFNQAKDLGFTVKKGSKTVVGLFASSFVPKEEREAAEKEDRHAYARPILKTFRVLHISDLEEYPEILEVENNLNIKSGANASRVFSSQKVLQGLISNLGASVSFEASVKAAFNPASDTVVIPSMSQFNSEEGFISTILHELAHWTGHKDRLGRLENGYRFGTPEYALEEIIAEVTSYLVSVENKMPFNPSEHQSYIKSWSSKAFSGDKDKLKNLYSQISAATGYLNENMPEIPKVGGSKRYSPIAIETLEKFKESNNIASSGAIWEESNLSPTIERTFYIYPETDKVNDICLGNTVTFVIPTTGPLNWSTIRMRYLDTDGSKELFRTVKQARSSLKPVVRGAVGFILGKTALPDWMEEVPK